MNSQNKGINPKRFWLFLCGGTGLLTLIFYFFGSRGLTPGFPLDDAWIHQTYARNLIQYGTWSFIPGKVSGGSTSPLWTIILAIGHAFSENAAYYWTLFISAAFFILFVVFLTKGLMLLRKNSRVELAVFIFLVAAEWHLNWASVSGMETILYCLGIALVFYLLLQENPLWWWVGLVNGLLIWIRPDGLTLLGPAAVILVAAFRERKINTKHLVSFLLPLLGIIGTYLLFNRLTTGNVFPNTFYAKQSEYQGLWSSSLWQRVLGEFNVLIIGSGAILLPGFLYEIYSSVRTKNWKIAAFIVWILGFGILYAIRLPVTYQHGRYMIPVLPLYLVFGCMGIFEILAKIKTIKWRRRITFGVFTLILLVTLGFYVMGLRAYHEDVRVINELMVQPAKWIEANTERNDVVAVHDIGAMGYFSQRELIDLAGLANPEVIPFIRDEGKLFEYMKSKNVRYFVGLRGWYTQADSWGTVVQSFQIVSDDEEKATIVIQLR